MEKVRLSPLIELSNTASVKNLVIGILSQEWPLNVRKIHTKVEQRRPGISYHAVHKAVQQIVEEGVIKREKLGYLIDLGWIDRAIGLLGNIGCRGANTPLYLPGLVDLKEGDSRTFYFDTLAEADRYRKRLQLEYAHSQPTKPYVVIARHARSALLFSEKTLAFPTAPIRSVPTYYLLAGKTIPDEWCADYYRLQGAYARTSVDCAHNCDTRVVGDVIEQLYMPEDTLQSMFALFSSITNISELNVPEFYRNICLRKSPVKFIVMHNRELAEQIRGQILAHFETNKVAILDLDGTFVDPSFPIEVTKWLVSKGVLTGSTSEELVKVCDKHTSGKISRDVFVLEYLKLYSKAIKGLSPASIEREIKAFIEAEGHNKVFKHATRPFNLIKSYRKIIVITRLPLEFARALSNEFSEIIATTFEVVDDKFTGKIQQNMCTVGAKDAAFSAWLASNNAIDMEDSIGVGDRYHDMAFLSKVKHPIVINPDPKLASVAQQKGWPIFSGGTPGLMEKINEVLR